MVRVPAPTMAVSGSCWAGIAIEFLARFYLACREAGNKIEIEIKASPLPYNNSLKPAQVRAGRQLKVLGICSQQGVCRESRWW